MVTLDTSPDFGFKILLDFEEPIPDVELDTNLLRYDSGETQKSFTIISKGE